jgi:hypothetical protein
VPLSIFSFRHNPCRRYRFWLLRRHLPSLIEFILFLNVLFEFFCSFHVPRSTFRDQILSCLVLFVFNTQRESTQGISIIIQSLFVLSGIVGLDGFFDNFDALCDHGAVHDYF